MSAKETEQGLKMRELEERGRQRLKRIILVYLLLTVFFAVLVVR